MNVEACANQCTWYLIVLNNCLYRYKVAPATLYTRNTTVPKVLVFRVRNIPYSDKTFFKDKSEGIVYWDKSERCFFLYDLNIEKSRYKKLIVVYFEKHNNFFHEVCIFSNIINTVGEECFCLILYCDWCFESCMILDVKQPMLIRINMGKILTNISLKTCYAALQDI